MEFYAWTDGASRGNPGKAAAGGIIKDSEGQVIETISEPLGVQTNNYAEYKALFLTLQAALRLGIKNITVRLDSKLVVEQVKGNWKVSTPSILPLYMEVRSLFPSFDSVTVVHVKRNLNTEADALANKALDTK
jgi:ribonuclease HI